MRLAPFLVLTIALVIPSSGVMVHAAPFDSTFPPPKNVLELFTSQGCDSCPPADEVLQTYADRDDIIAITLPVDIWDYLGWKDTMASQKNSERQKAYAKTRGDGAIYTPQVVVNGLEGVNGSKPGEIDKAIKTTENELRSMRVPIRFWFERNTIYIEAGQAPPGTHLKQAIVWFAVVQKLATVPIEQGENKGKTLTYTNIVREMSPVGVWKGKPMSVALARTAIMRPETEACVVLLQDGRGGPIIGAAWSGLW
jgi:hypothetical protein